MNLPAGLSSVAWRCLRRLGRRAGPVLAALALPVVAAGPAPAPTPTATPDRPPNIVVLVADDWGFTDVGAFGGEIATPHLDDLARQGVRFSNFHVAASCSPTRSMLLTGVEHHRAGVGNLRESMPREHLGRPGYLGSLNTRVVSVASLLQAAGYRTYISGKWNVGSEPHNLPPQRGFDRSIIQGDTGSDNWVPSQRYLPHSAKVSWFEDGREAVMPAEYYSSAYFVDRMIEYLRSDQASGKPFFAYVGFQANHVPLQAPRAYVDRYRGRYDTGWTALRQARHDRAAALGLLPAGVPMTTMSTTRDWAALAPDERRHQARSMEVYAGMAEAMDHHVGRLIAHLKASGEAERTVFVFLSDNGPEGSDYADAQLWLATQYTQAVDKLGDKGAYAIPGPGWASATASPFDTYKFYAGEGGLRVPLIIAGAPVLALGGGAVTSAGGTVAAASAPAGGSNAGGATTLPARIHHGLTHVTDIVPTLLELARVAHPGTQWRGQPIEPLAGRSLVPALADPRTRLRTHEDAIGYELSGNQAYYRGDLKLVSNLPPVGDGQWHLYDLRTDPGETRDLREQRPEAFAAMKAGYETWAATHQVLPMPAGYSPQRQVLINSVLNYWWPSYRVPAGIAVAGLVALAWAWRRRRRARP